MKYPIIFFSIIVFLFSCKKEKTEWTSDWNLPIINDTLTLKHFVNDSTLKVNNSNLYEVNLHRTLLDISLTDLIKIPDTTINESYSIAFQSLTIAPGTSYVNPSQVNEHNFELKDLELKKIRLKKGILSITLKNVISTKIFYTITLPGVTKNGLTFQHIYAAPQGTPTNPGIVTESIDLTGYFIDLTGSNGGSSNILQSLVAVKTDPNGPTVTIKNSDITKFQANFKDIEIDYARGYFGNRIVSDSNEFTLPIFNKFTNGSIDLSASNIKFNISNGLKINALAKINFIKNTNKQQNTVSIFHPQIGQNINLDPATGTVDNFTSSKKTIEFNSTNSNITNYLENLGEKHSISYSLELNPWGNVSGGWNELFPTSKINISVDAAMPLAIGMNNLTLQDTFEIDVIQNRNKTHINSGKFIATIQNAFPFSGQISLQLLSKSNELMYTIPATSKIESSLFGTPIGNGIYLNKSSLNFVLNEEIISHIEDIKKVVAIVVFNSPDANSNSNSKQSIPANSYLGLKIKAAFELINKY